jgi:hypothetical protein
MIELLLIHLRQSSPCAGGAGLTATDKFAADDDTALGN